MKILSKKQAVYERFVERYELNGLYLGGGLRAGLLACWLLATDEGMERVSLRAAEEAETGGDRDLLRYEGGSLREEYPEAADFVRRAEERNISEWELHAVYEGKQITLTGDAWGTGVGASYPVKTPVNLLPLLTRAEERSFALHPFPPEQVSRMRESFRLDQRGAVRALNKLAGYPDLLAEFTAGLTAEGFAFPEEGGLCEQGYTARALHEGFPLSPLGAYNYLIYLRESPQEALADLKRGLPRN